MNTHLRRALGAAAAMLVLNSAFASAEESPPQFGPWVRGLAGGAAHQGKTDFSDGPGDFSVNRGFFQGSMGYAWNRDTSVSVSLGAGSSVYNFSDEVTVGGETPWEEIRDYRISTPIRFAPTENTNAIIIPSLRSYAETGADLEDGLSTGLLAGVSWTLSEDLSIGPGIGWFSELGGGSSIFPILVIDWNITDTLSLSTGQGMAASQGPGLGLYYKPTKKWSLGLAGRYEKTRFALNDNNGADRIGEDKSLPIVFTAEYSPWPMTSISFMAGVETEGRLKLEDGSGKSLGGSAFKPAPIVGITFSTLF